MTQTLSMEEEIDRIESRLEEIKERGSRVQEDIEDWEETARLTDDNQKASDARSKADDLRSEWNSLDGEFKSLSGRLSGLRSALDKWGEGNFEIRELTYGNLMMAKDEVQRASYKKRQGNFEGVPRDGFYRIKVLELALVDGPSEANIDNPEDLPLHVGEWLYERIDALNTVGEMDMGNCSLEEALNG